MIIYKATNRLNGKIYIGQTVNSLRARLKTHISYAENGSVLHFHSAIRKYGKDNFYWQVICICPDINSLNEREQFYIALYDSINVGYNLQSGGLNYRASEETKKKLRQVNSGEKNHNFGKRFSKKTRKRMREGHLNMSDKAKREMGEAISKAGKGRIFTEEHRKNLSNNHWDNSGGNHPNYGKHRTDKTKQKLREAHLKYWLGRKHSKEQNSNQCLLNLGGSIKGDVL